MLTEDKQPRSHEHRTLRTPSALRCQAPSAALSDRQTLLTVRCLLLSEKVKKKKPSIEEYL